MADATELGWWERELKLAWAAGFLDGDGSFNISMNGSRNRPGVSLMPCVSATSERPEPLEELVAILGGYLNTVHHNGGWMPGKKYCHWRLRAGDAADVCRLLVPYLVLKQEQAELLIEAWDNRGKLPDGHRGYNMNETERAAVIAKRQEYCLAASALNGRKVGK